MISSRRNRVSAEHVNVLMVLLPALAICLLDFYGLLPAFSLYTLRLVECEEN
jgi:hypothetical protein